MPRLAPLALLPALLLLTSALTGCIAAGVTSGGHFFIFPGLGVLVLIVVVFLVMRRR